MKLVFWNASCTPLKDFESRMPWEEFKVKPRLGANETLGAEVLETLTRPFPNFLFICILFIGHRRKSK
jgi:hypothetical protein